MSGISDRFESFARQASVYAGSLSAFTAASAIVLMWIIAGFFVGFSDELFQLSINTLTTIVTFLMVFVIQNSQNRDTQVIQMKLDELIRVTGAARNDLIRAEDLPGDQVQALRD